MRIYRAICYKVEDIFVKMLSKKQNSALIKEKVNRFRIEKMSDK